MKKMLHEEHYVRFDKSITQIVKGFALIFMMLLHCYGRENYDAIIDFSQSLVVPFFHPEFKICVGMFVFMVGYGYSFSIKKDWKYSLQHIKKLLNPFWTILFVFTFPFCFDSVVHDFKISIYNLFGIDSSFNYYSWFVYFFIFAMVVMPFISRFIDKKPIRNTIIVIVVASLFAVIVHEVHRLFAVFDIMIPNVVDNKPHLAFFNCCMMTPIMSLGYLFAHEGYYERIKVSDKPRLYTFIICLVIILLSFILRHLTSNIHNPFQLDIFYAPLVIGSIVVLFNRFRWTYFRRLMIKIGELSVYMWFFHALFYTKAVRWFYQPVITIFNDINLVVLWTIILTFFASWLIKSIVDAIYQRIS